MVGPVHRLAIDFERNLPGNRQLQSGRGDDDIGINRFTGFQLDAALGHRLDMTGFEIGLACGNRL